MAKKDITKRRKNEVIYEAQIDNNQKSNKELLVGISAVIILVLFIGLILLFS